MSVFRRRVAGVVTAVLSASLLSAVIAPSPALAAGPSVDLPTTPSTGVVQERMQGRDQDPASRNALRGDQDAGNTPKKEGAGTPKATSLSPSAAWQVSAQTGDFTWSYPLRVPPAPGGLVPRLALTYASSSVDGRTSATNNQASWVGDGWDLSPGFVERVYGACADDKAGGTIPPKVGDLCWRSDNAVASYPGAGGVLICCDGDGRWRSKTDDGARIERLTGAGNGDNDGEYWKITALDGTQYFFGSRPDAGSTWTVPVFGDDAGEPCHQSAGFAASHCTQAWRWNLDRVVDRNGNVMVYGYRTESNSYGMNDRDAAVGYVRGGTLATVEYGLRDGQPATGRMEFTVADRCVPGSDCRPEKKDNWPDVPWDEKCDTATCDDRHSPTFWSTKRLSKITTQVRRDTGFTDVDSWTLDQQFPNPGDGEKATLWLKGIVHTGHVGATAALPAVTFEGSMFPNRVFSVDGVAPLTRYRITAVVSESGGSLSVRYANPDCVAGSSMPANPETNTLRCYPVRWARSNETERTDYFHKYVVESVTLSDRFTALPNPITANTQQVTRYEYLGGAAWHYDTSEFTEDDKRTWDEFRGFGRVLVRTGTPDDPAGPIGKTEQRFYRGMHGDKQPSGTRDVAVRATEGPARADEDWLNGSTLETITYDGDTDRVVSKVIEEPTWRGPTATRDSLRAYLVRTGATETWTALAGGGWRTTRTESTYDDRGLVETVDDLGDVATADDDRCVRTWYVRNPDRWLLDFPSRVETVAVRCGATPSFPADAIGDVRNAYDGQAAGAVPTAGNVTRSEELSARPAAGPQYVTTGTSRYDAHGRVVEAGDALGRLTKTAYTPAVGGPETQTVTTNPAGHQVTTTLEPAWGQPTLVVDANQRRTETAYDPLGRTVEVWLPNRSRAREGGNAKFSYLIRGNAPSVVTTTRINPAGGYTSSKEVYDGLLRLRQTQEPAPGGGRLLTDTRYDSQGRVYKTTQEYFNDAPIDDEIWVASDVEIPGQVVTRYDGAGREIAEVYQAGATERWRTTTGYGGDRVHVTPPAGGTASTTITDARGQTVELREYRGGTPAGAYDATRYTYTRAGQLASTTDPAGNTWRFGYDPRGNKVRSEDPDKGTSTMAYDAAGQLLTSTDARGVTLRYGYDPLGRKRTVESAGQTLASWTYDTALRGKGQLASSTRYVDGAAYTRSVGSYTELYHPYETSVTVPQTDRTRALAGTYTTYSTLNPDGSLYGVTRPAVGDLPKETLHWEYDALGNPVSLGGGPAGGPTVDYVTQTDYTRYGEVARLHLGQTGKRAWMSYYYETDTRRLSRTILDAELPRPMQTDVNYRYDAAGNITSIANTPRDLPADVQCFRYDHLRRLTEAWTPGGGCDAAPNTGALAGPAPYRHSYSYDLVGNRLTETRHAAGGDTVREYAYPAAGSHRLTSVTETGPAGRSTAGYGYDAAGNTVTRPGQELDWDAENALTRVTEGDRVTEFWYDADGGRLIRDDPSGTTVYLDGQDLRLDKTTGRLTGTRYYEHGETTVATRTAAGVTWQADDHQQTAQVAVDAASQKVTQRRQTPFGVPRGEAVPWAGDRGFVGGTADASTGLTQLGAREYDPRLGRFVSVDPVMDVSDAQQMHGYTYANNSPVTFSDPTGLFLGGLLRGIGKAVKKVGEAVSAVGRAVDSVARTVGNAARTVGRAVATAAKWAAPYVGVAALVASVVATGGVAAAVLGAASFTLGAINAAHNCTGGGPVGDCMSDLFGSVPGVGKIGVGLVRQLRFVRALPDAKAAAGAVANGSNAYRWLAQPSLGRTGEIWDKVGTGTGVLHAAACDYVKAESCDPPPAAEPVPLVQPLQPVYVPQPIPFLPIRVYPHNFVGPIPANAVRAAPPGPRWPSRSNTPPAPAPAPPSDNGTYKTPDGRICNRGGGMCAI